MALPEVDPAEVYRQRLRARREEADAARRRELALTWLRLAIALTALALVWPVVMARTLDWIWLAAPIAGFLAVALWHDRVIRGRRRSERSVAWYEEGLERLAGRWAGRGRSGTAFADPAHPYARDLDLFGRGSLFELLCRARTQSGERILAAWLGEAARPSTVALRQQAVAELRPQTDFREALAVAGEEVGGDVDPDALVAWATAPPRLAGGWIPWTAAALGAVNYGSLVLAPAYPVARLVFVASAAGSALLAMALRGRTHRVLHGVEHPSDELRLLAVLLEQIELERFSSGRLAELRRELDGAGGPPARRIAHLARLVEWHESRHNLLFAPFAALALTGTQIAAALERWRVISGPAVARWIAAVGEVEALASFATHAFENPSDPFPELVDGPARYEGTGLGHPLLPAEATVRNDVTLGPELRLWIVSGSNMSGKSTLLRTVGVNAVLAQAGAPVRAAGLCLTPLAVGACMRVEDSLQEGTSHFYAEIKRLRQIVELGSAERALLFLLDEILHGTNSHDRRIGAAALARGLVARGALGLITTHDLALAQIADELAPLAANVHFTDHLEHGRIVFDYRLRPGVVERSNALELMRAVGLDV